MLASLTTTQLVVLITTALFIGMSKTGIQGATILVVPQMAIAFGAKVSTGLQLPMLCIADIIAVAYYKRSADWKQILRLLPMAVIGFFVAILVDEAIPKDAFKILLGWTLILTLLVMILSEIYGKENRWMHSWWYSAVFGIFGGFTTMIGNAAGPVMSIYLLSMRKEKMEFIGTNAWFFLIVNLMKVPLQIFVWHNISFKMFSMNLMMIPVIIVGAVIGIFIVKKIPDKYFRRFIQIATAISVVVMLR